MSGFVVTCDSDGDKMWFGGFETHSCFPGAWSLDEREAYIYRTERHAAAVRNHQEKLESTEEERNNYNIRVEPTVPQVSKKVVRERTLRIRRQPVDSRCGPHDRIYYDVIVNGECVSFVVCPLSGTTWVEIGATNARVAYDEAANEEAYTRSAVAFTRLTGFRKPTSFERAFAKSAHLSLLERAHIRYQRHAIAALHAIK